MNECDRTRSVSTNNAGLSRAWGELRGAARAPRVRLDALTSVRIHGRGVAALTPRRS